ncbi:hypothetical protein A2U01_0089720, partial [Trifolium medium]|nr:hypothetical protein [Trifolium medium]
MSLEILISNLRSHEMVLNANVAAQKKSKSVALQSIKTSSKALKANLLRLKKNLLQMAKKMIWEMKIL